MILGKAKRGRLSLAPMKFEDAVVEFLKVKPPKRKKATKKKPPR